MFVYYCCLFIFAITKVTRTLQAAIENFNIVIKVMWYIFSQCSMKTLSHGVSLILKSEMFLKYISVFYICNLITLCNNQ